MQIKNSAFMFLSVSLMTLSSFAKAPPCVQWFGTCVKSKVRDVYSVDGDIGKISVTKAAVQYELLEQDGGVSQHQIAAEVNTYVGVPAFIGNFKERRSLSSACKQILAELDSRRCE